MHYDWHWLALDLLFIFVRNCGSIYREETVTVFHASLVTQNRINNIKIKIILDLYERISKNVWIIEFILSYQLRELARMCGL